MKKLLFIAAMLLMVSSASAQKKEAKTVYIVDGKIVTEQEFKAIPEGEIKEMNIEKGVKSVVYASTKDEPSEMIITGFRKDGKESIHIASTDSRDIEREISTLADKGKKTEILKSVKGSGASMVITPNLKSDEDLKVMRGTITRTHTNVSNGKVTNVTIISNAEGNKLMLNDKTPVFLVVDNEGNTTRINDLSEIDAVNIESMLVCKKEDEAVKKYGDKYGDLKDGVIVITLRKPDANNPDATQKELKMITVRGDGQIAQKYGPSGSLFLGYGNPTILVTDANGKTAKTERVEDIKIDEIESFDVIKDEKKRKEYEKKYGPSKDGYIHIELKKKK